MGGENGIQHLAPPINIGDNERENSGVALNPAVAPSIPVLDSVTVSSATSTGLPAEGDSVTASTQRNLTSHLNSSINVFFSGDSGEQGQRALSLTSTTGVHNNSRKDGNDSDSSRVNKGALISFFIWVSVGLRPLI